MTPQLLCTTVKMGVLQSEPPVDYGKMIKSLNTHARLIEHTDRVEPKNYESTTRSQFQKPNHHSAWVGPLKPGPREQMRLAAHKAMVAKQLEVEAQKKARQQKTGTYETNMGASFVYEPEKFHDEVCHVRQAKEKRGSKYRQLPTWEPRLTGKIPANDYKTDTAITLFSMALKDPNQTTFSISAANNKNPFARSSTFTNSVWDEPYKTHEGAFDMPGHTPSSLGITIQQRTMLEDLRQRVRVATGGLSDEHVARCFAEFDVNADQKITIHEFVGGLSRLGLELDDKELSAIVAVFDHNRDNTLTPEEFFSTLRKL